MLNAHVPQRYTVLREFENSSRNTFPLPEKPLQVWTLIDEEKFLQLGLVHNVSAFIEDSVHDWDWEDGKFRFYGHSSAKGEKVDLVLVWVPCLYKQWDAVKQNKLKSQSWYPSRLNGRKGLRQEQIMFEIARDLVEAQQEQLNSLASQVRQLKAQAS
jgi:hypothetical protein